MLSNDTTSERLIQQRAAHALGVLTEAELTDTVPAALATMTTFDLLALQSVITAAVLHVQTLDEATDLDTFAALCRTVVDLYAELRTRSDVDTVTLPEA